jgi:exosortase K
VKTKLAMLTFVLVVAWAVKRHYAEAPVDDLWWILEPTVRLVSITTGATFVIQPGEGYFSQDRLFLIEKSCAGINFMIAAFAMLAVGLRHRVNNTTATAAVLGSALIGSYVAAVVINVARISFAMSLADHPMSTVSAADVHRLEGIFVYFLGLVLVHELVQRFDGQANSITRGFRGMAIPLAAYYAVTLAVPLANGATRSGAPFAKHAFVVFVVPLIIIACMRIVCAIACTRIKRHQQVASSDAQSTATSDTRRGPTSALQSV